MAARPPLRQLIGAIAIGLAIGVLVYVIASAVIEPDLDKVHVSHRQMSRFTFVL